MPDYLTGATISPEKVAWMERHLPSRAGQVLDLGCGACLYARWLANRGWKVTAVDIAPEAIPGVRVLRHDLESGLPFPANSFDAVIAWDVLEHLAADKEQWLGLARVLAPGGVLLGSVPHANDDRLRPYNLTFKHHTDKTHHREYRPGELEQRLGELGLTSRFVELKGPVSPQVVSEFVRIRWARRPVARVVGAARRLGLLGFGELFADIFFAARKPTAGL